MFNPWNPPNFSTFSCAPLKSSVERASSTKLTSSFSRRCRRWLRPFRGGFPPVASARCFKMEKRTQVTKHHMNYIAGKKYVHIKFHCTGWFVGISPREWYIQISTRKGGITTYMTQRTGGGFIAHMSIAPKLGYQRNSQIARS